MTLDELQHRVDNGPACYLDLEFADAFAEITGQPQTTVIYIVRADADEREREMSGRNKRERAVRAACNAIISWYKQANEYRIDKVSDFVASHRQACVWAVLVGRGM